MGGQGGREGGGEKKTKIKERNKNGGKQNGGKRKMEIKKKHGLYIYIVNEEEFLGLRNRVRIRERERQ